MMNESRMTTTQAEHLPDELWLKIFTYLETIDLFYGFYKLNKRFKQIIHPYLNEIDLSEVSLKQWNIFINEILLSKADYQIYSLTLKNSGQFQKIFYSQNHFLFQTKTFRYLQSLKLTIDHWFHEFDLFQLTLPKLSSSLSHLTDLHLNILPDTFMKPIFRSCFQSISFPLTLTHLTIVGFWKKKIRGYVNLKWFQLPINIKSFAFAIDNLETLYRTDLLQRIHLNLEELKIALNYLNFFDEKYSKLIFPKSLISLHIEILTIQWKFLSKFLKLFPREIKSLILILRLTTKIHLDDQFIMMIKEIFPVLETFQYKIYFSDEIITNTYRLSSPFSDLFKRNLNTKNSLNIDVQSNSKVNKFTYRLSLESIHNDIHLLTNLTSLKLIGNNSQKMIEILKFLPTKHLRKVHFNLLNYHQSFLIDLVTIISHIRELRLENLTFISDDDQMKNVLSVITALKHIEIYFKELIHLYIYMTPFSYLDKKMFQINQEFQQWLNDEQQSKRFYSIYRIHQSYEKCSLSNEDYCIYQKTFPYCLYVSP
ncbi:hypothetical protein I4U23_005181 [Adineta vaga]|nr:hypothetical protein I4U23_005181 [Adineta vaga]